MSPPSSLLTFALCASILSLGACSSEPSGNGAADPPGGGQADASGAGPSPSSGVDAGPVDCVSPAPAASSTVSHPAGSPTVAITLPVSVTGTTTEAIDFQYFTFTLADVAKLRLKTSVSDFTAATEKTGIGIEVRTTTLGQDNNVARVSAHVDPSTPSSTGVSGWLYPGEYQVVFSRATYASASTTTPTLPHAYAFSIDVELPPGRTDTCAWPSSATSATDVMALPECDAWCKKLPACKVACRTDCDIPIGQCEESVRQQLACLAGASFECVTQGGGNGYSTDADCKADPKVCPAGTIRQK